METRVDTLINQTAALTKVTRLSHAPQASTTPVLFSINPESPCYPLKPKLEVTDPSICSLQCGNID